GIEGRAHALPDLAIPGAFVCADVYASLLPKPQFGRMRAGLVTARYKRRLLVPDGLEGGCDIVRSGHAGGILLGTDEHEVIIRDIEALYAITFLDKLLLLSLGM